MALSLKNGTADVHERVEVGLDLLSPRTSPARLRDVLLAFSDVWSQAEGAVDRWAARQPHPAHELDWARRRGRSALITRDLEMLASASPAPAIDHRLGAPPTPPALPRQPAYADVMGWLYVSEGSTLGGAVIDRWLRGAPSTAHLRLLSFVPYAEGPGPMWQRYQRCLADWAGADRARHERVVAAARRAFGALEARLRPVLTPPVPPTPIKAGPAGNELSAATT